MTRTPSDPGEPDDDEIEARIVRPDAPEWDGLWAAVEVMAAVPPDDLVTWKGGEKLPDGSILMPWAEYHPAVREVIGALGSIGAIVPFDWPSWNAPERYPNGEGLTDAPVAHAVRVVTSIVRSDRFVEGSLEGAIDSGTLSAAIERLCIWWSSHQP